MTQYIDKPTVVAEIERRIEENKKEIQRVTDKYLKGYFEGYENALVLFKKQFLDTVNTAEIKYYKGIEIKIERYINKKHPQYNYVGFTARQGENI